MQNEISCQFLCESLLNIEYIHFLCSHIEYIEQNLQFPWLEKQTI